MSVFIKGIFAHGPIDLFNISLWTINRFLTNTTTLGQSGSGSYANEGILHSAKIEPHCQMQFSIFIYTVLFLYVNEIWIIE